MRKGDGKMTDDHKPLRTAFDGDYSEREYNAEKAEQRLDDEIEEVLDMLADETEPAEYWVRVAALAIHRAAKAKAANDDEAADIKLLSWMLMDDEHAAKVRRLVTGMSATPIDEDGDAYFAVAQSICKAAGL
jgi:hypothetical protein